MKIKIKYPSNRGEIRVENDVDIKEVFIKEDLLIPNAEKVTVGFTNKDSSGIIEFSGHEMDRLFRTMKDKMHLIKAFKVIKDERTPKYTRIHRRRIVK